MCGLIIAFLFVINIGIVHLTRGAEWMRWAEIRLAKFLSFTTATAIAIVFLGLRVLGIKLYQSEHPKYSNQLKTQCPLLVKYDVILFITAHHPFPRGVPLVKCTMLLLMPLFLLFSFSHNIIFYIASAFCWIIERERVAVKRIFAEILYKAADNAA